MRPSFIIIGGVKCASSSLYRYLNYHPQVLPCKTKEPGYFNTTNLLKLAKGYKRYMNLFPHVKQGEVIGEWLDLGADGKMHSSQFAKQVTRDKHYITGEATANLISNANPKWVKMILPKVKLMLLMRNPSERFISHYNMFMRFHNEGRQGYDLGELEYFVQREIQAYKAGKKTRILSQGMYINDIPRWKKAFGDNLRLYKTTTLSSPTANDTMNEICEYLGIELYDFEPILKVKYNTTGTSIERGNAFARLEEFYTPQIEELNERYNIDLRIV